MPSNHPNDTNPESWHRFFAIENNNLAWELAGRPSRSPDESREMLNAAHAAAVHWAHAAAVAGLVDEHRASYSAAQQAIDAIADEEDRKIVLQTFDQVMVPQGAEW